MARFNSDPTIVGQPITIAGQPFTIVGVSQRGFDGVELGYSPKIRVPIAMKVQLTQGFFAEFFNLENRRAFWTQVFARLAPGVDRAQAQASLQPLFRSILRQEISGPGFEHTSARVKADFLRSTLAVDPGSQGRSSLREDYDTPLRVLMAMVGLILLLACANLANLILERALSRREEIAVRLALGARPGHILRQVLAESLLVSIAGATAGLVLAVFIGEWLVAFVPFESLSPEASLGIDASTSPRVLGFTLAVSVITGLLFGIVPALAARRTGLTVAMGREGRAVTGRQARLRQGLVILQVSLSVLLLYAAGQFLRTLVNLRHVDTGLRAEHVVTFSVNPSLNGYDKPRSRAFYRDLMARLRVLPGIESAGASAIRLLSGDWWGSGLTLDVPSRDRDRRPNALCNLVSPGFTSTLGIPIRAGRDFVPADADRSERVALVNDTFARRYFGGRSPIGHRVGLGDAPGVVPDILIVGVVGDTKYSNIRNTTSPQLLLNNDQNPDVQFIVVYLRTTMDPGSAYATVRGVIRELDRNVPVFDMRTVKAQAEISILRERMLANLAAAFGALATALAAIGVHALIAFNVTRKMREIGVRLALGADQQAVVWLVMREVLWLVGIAAAVAIPIAWALARIVESQFYGVAGVDPLTTIAAMALLGGTALVAGYLPARRATRIDPIQVLRAVRSEVEGSHRTLDP